MSNIKLTTTRLLEGIWEGILTSQDSNDNYQPDIEVSHLNKPLDGVSVTEDRDNGWWLVRVPVPAAALSDGVHSFVISDKRTGAKLNSFSILAGEPLNDDIRAELELLRAELDMLKKAFRRHCLETM